MWLFVPNCTFSPSALEAEDSISESSWRSKALEAFVWWRGKPSRSRSWSQRCAKVSFVRLLYGAMPEPSTADVGVDAWTASLAASRASHTVSPESVRVQKTTATSGQMLAGSLCNPEHGSSSSKTSAACSPRSPASIRELSESAVTYSDWASVLRQDCSRRQKLARRMKGNGSSSSGSQKALARPTPQAFDATDLHRSQEARERALEKGGCANLREIAVMFEGSARPTPTANDWKGSGPTLERSDGKMRGDRLDYMTEQVWQATARPSPSVTDSNGARNRTSGRTNPDSKHHDGVTLNDAIEMWATPSVADTTGGRMSRSGARANEPLLKGQAVKVSTRSTPRATDGEKGGPNSRDGTGSLHLPSQATSFHQVHPTYQVGQVSSSPRRSLNPLFVEWLMGWPPGWTLLAWTDFACSATALFHFKQRMRSALSQLGLPEEAPPAQLALFG